MDFKEAMKVAKECENTATPMPQYQCHKKVWALKIKEVVRAPLPTIAELEQILSNDADPMEVVGGFIVPEGQFAPIGVPTKFMDQHKPEAGGYLVFYKDGYRSFSPAEAFEEGYARI